MEKKAGLFNAFPYLAGMLRSATEVLTDKKPHLTLTLSSEKYEELQEELEVLMEGCTKVLVDTEFVKESEDIFTLQCYGCMFTIVKGYELINGKKPLQLITEQDAIEVLSAYHGDHNRYRLSKDLFLECCDGYLKDGRVLAKLERLGYSIEK